MKKQLATFALAIVMGMLGFAVSGVAVAGNGKPPSPPGQDECEHGNAAKPCKEDPEPDNGKDCEEHGNHGGVNEDHCKGEETPPSDTTPSDTTPSDTTPGQTTPSETTTQPAVPSDGSNPSAPPSTASGEPSSTQQPDGSFTQTTDPSPEQASESSSSQSSQATPKVLGKPPAAAAKKKPATALSVTATAAKPTRKAQQAPLTL
jgi:hypothetical protein